MYQQFILAIHSTTDEVDDHIQLFKQISDQLTNGMWLAMNFNIEIISYCMSYALALAFSDLINKLIFVNI